MVLIFINLSFGWNIFFSSRSNIGLLWHEYSNWYSIFDHFNTLIRSIKEPETFTERKSFFKYQITDLHFHISDVQRRLRFLDMHVAFDFRLAQIGLNLIYFHSWVALIRECYLPCKRRIEEGKSIWSSWEKYAFLLNSQIKGKS